MVGFCHGGNIPLGHDNDDGDDDEDGHGTHGLQATVQKVPTENQTLKHDMGPCSDHHHYYRCRPLLVLVNFNLETIIIII